MKTNQIELLGKHWNELSPEALVGRVEIALTIMKVMERVCRELNDTRESKAYAHCYDILSTGEAREKAGKFVKQPTSRE